MSSFLSEWTLFSKTDVFDITTKKGVLVSNLWDYIIYFFHPTEKNQRVG